MKRFHVHVSVDDLTKSIQFYSTVFAQQPTVLKEDYAKWMLDDPRINFAISKRSAPAGINHLGLQVETDDELADIHARLERADAKVLTEEGVSCCYARSNKHWITDPQGIAWETFQSLGEIPLFNGEAADAISADVSEASECCAPTASVRIPAEIGGKANTACCAPSPKVAA